MSEARNLLLKAATHLSVLTDGSHPVIAEIKEYLEKPEQEPVAWIDGINFNSLPDKAWVLQCYESALIRQCKAAIAKAAGKPI